MADATPASPQGGARITIDGGNLQVPDEPIIPFIEGDGTGPDIWRASVRVLDAAVEKAYGAQRKIREITPIKSCEQSARSRGERRGG